MSPRAAGAIVLGLWIGVCGSASAAELTERREPCADSNRLRKPYFGDLHVHTTFSLDASTQGTRNRPHDAYRFARGARLEVQPYDSLGKGLRTIQLARPLDFAAVTDHAEMLGETEICQSPGLPDMIDFNPGGLAGWRQASSGSPCTRSQVIQPTERVSTSGPAGPAAATSTAFAPCGPIPTPLRSDASQDGSGARVELADLVYAR